MRSADRCRNGVGRTSVTDGSGSCGNGAAGSNRARAGRTGRARVEASVPRLAERTTRERTVSIWPAKQVAIQLDGRLARGVPRERVLDNGAAPGPERGEIDARPEGAADRSRQRR